MTTYCPNHETPTVPAVRDGYCAACAIWVDGYRVEVYDSYDA